MGENSGMHDMVERVNKLQNVFNDLKIEFTYDLPQIAVIGGQSAGKSSVLESFVGRDFLPRGTGVVTRRPLILQLVNDPSEEYATFSHKQTKFTDFDEVRDEILAETWKETGNSNGFSSRPINLRIHSPNVLTLTLIDLPGIVKVADVNQPEDIEDQIYEMILPYIEKKNCLILAVTSATQDLATSDALQLARKVDPDGVRTIGVLTKLDLMDKGTDVLDILQGYYLPLERGYVGVVNRSQQDIEHKVNIKVALEKEDAFFKTHEKYGQIADRMGTRFLQRLLNKELNEHIRKTLPELRTTLQERLGEVDRTLDEYVPIAPESMPKLLLEIISGLRDSFELEIGRSSSVKVNTNELEGGAKINQIMNDEYPKRVGKIILMNEELCSEIAMAIQNVHGVYLGIFTPDMAFEAVIRKQIERFREPSLECIDRVSSVLVQIINNCVEKLHAYPKLKGSVQKVINEHIKECQQEAKQRLMYMVYVQSSYMNTNHEDFVGIHAMEKVLPSYDTAQGQVNSTAELNNMSATTAGFRERSGFMAILLERTNTAPATTVRCWGKLTWDILSWYKDDKETERISMITGLHDWAVLPGTNPKSFTLIQSRLGKQVELTFDSQRDLTEWVTALIRAGVQPDGRNGSIVTPPPNPAVPPRRPENRNSGTRTNTPAEMQTPVEIIRRLVESYVAIMRKTFKDYMPKIVMHAMINSVRRFISSELLVELRAYGEETDLMAGDPEVEFRQRNLQLRKAAINNAITLIDEP